jgi:site-specific DNA-methyltransferase (adenine-specific)
MDTNALYYGDNLDVLRRHVPDESVDLVYLDPPFNSNRSYNVLFRESSGKGSDAQIEAFGDTWHWGHGAQAAYEEVLTGRHQQVARVLKAMLDGLGHNDVTAYLAMMSIRLIELHRVLKPSGSIFLHCDPTASHYLKVIMDSTFGPKNFKNEIVWKRSHPHGNITKKFGAIHDIVLFYARDASAAKWSQPIVPHDPSDPKVKTQYTRWDEERQDWWQPTSLLNPNPNRPNLTYEFHGHTKVWRWTRDRMLEAERKGDIYVPPDGGIPRFKRFLSDQRGLLLQDVWDDIEPVSGEENLGYETQKPLELLLRIVQASSDKGDIVLDPFCGCGTAVHAAQLLGRRWVGIDITHLAIGLIRRRMKDAFPALRKIVVIGEPVDLGGARELAKQDKYQFQWWALDRIGAQPVAGKKKGSDKGIDGVIPYVDAAPSEFKRVIVSVKGGEQVGVTAVRELIAVMKREDEPLGLLVTLNKPTRDMQVEATSAGHYENELWQKSYPRVQILTIADILAGKQPEMPPQHSPFAKAPVERERAEKPRLL